MRHRIGIVLLTAALCAASCGKGNVIGTLHETLEEARPKPRVELQIVAAGRTVTPDELRIQKSIEESIERENVGRVVRSSSDANSMTITVEVDSTVDSIPKLRQMLISAGILSRSVIRVIPPS